MQTARALPPNVQPEDLPVQNTIRVRSFFVFPPSNEVYSNTIESDMSSICRQKRSWVAAGETKRPSRPSSGHPHPALALTPPLLGQSVVETQQSRLGGNGLENEMQVQGPLTDQVSLPCSTPWARFAEEGAAPPTAIITSYLGSRGRSRRTHAPGLSISKNHLSDLAGLLPIRHG